MVLVYSWSNRAMFFLKEFRRFLRVETGILIVCVALSGYLIFNSPSPDMLFLVIAMFFGSGASYAYNHYTDQKEDKINNRGINFFASSNKGYCIIAVCTVTSLFSAFRLPPVSFTIYMISLVGSFAYSMFRVKRIFPMKNIYSGIFLSTPFLVGATAGNQFLVSMIPYFLLIFLIGLTSNLMGDVRGYEGDRLAGLRTIPVVIGTRASKWIIHINLILFSFVTIMLGYSIFIPMIPFLVMVLFFLDRNEHTMARSSVVLTFLILVFISVLMEVLGV